MQFKNVLRTAIAISATSLLAVVGFTTPVSAASLVEKTYVVVAPNKTLEKTDSLVNEHGGQVTRQFNAIHARTATMTAAEAAQLDAVPGVIVSEDKIVSINGVQSNPPSWGLDRIDQTNLPLNSSYTFGNSDTGSGVKAYVIDTGILATHQEFRTSIGSTSTRVLSGYTAINDGRGTTDCNGHGTHVSGTIAGLTVGIARSASIVPVRVLNCQGSGSTSGIAAAVNWVVSNHLAGQPAVANMSLGGGADSVLDSLITSMYNDGITVVVAAGNDNLDACTTSPARAPLAITVAASAIDDTRASYSNFGTCVDIFAPGGDGADLIYSSYYRSTSSYAWMAGTSMASPHVAGAAARFLSANPTATPSQVRAALVGASTADLVTNPGTGSPNQLLYVNPAGFGAAPAEPLSAPNSVSASAVNFGGANVTWSAPTSTGGETITGYIVTPVVAGVPGTPAPVSGTATSKTFTGLTAGTAYTFNVQATTSSVASGGPTATSNSITAAGQAAAPTGITARKISSSKITVSWTGLTPGAQLGYSTLIRYEINRSTNGGATWSPTWTNAGTSTSYTFSGQKTGTNYAYKVRAYTVAGAGLESSTVTQVQAVSTRTNGRTR